MAHFTFKRSPDDPNYWIGDDGDVFSLYTMKTLAKRYEKKGYVSVRFPGNRYYKVARLVAKAYPEICGEWFEGCEVDHVNGIRDDNRAVNLKICTHRQNTNNPLTLEKFRQRQMNKRPGNAVKVSVDGVVFDSLTDASEYLGVRQVTLSAFKSGRIKNPSFAKHHRVEFI